MQGKRATLAAPVEHALLLGRGCKVLKAATTTITTTSTPPSYLVQRDATKVLSLESLPPVLVLSLGRFAVYGKRQDTVTFPVDLELPADVLAHSVGARVTYILSAAVVHLGPTMDQGHYVSYARTEERAGVWTSWVRFDDGQVSARFCGDHVSSW